MAAKHSLKIFLIVLIIVKSYSERLEARGVYSLQWTTENDEIQFTVTAKGTGWVGLGLGPNTGMTGADIIIGGVRNGQGYIYDMHGVDNDTPEKDAQQDYTLLDASENATHTMIKFKRKLDTNDAEDNPLTSLVWVLWAYNRDEDANDGKFPYHGIDRSHFRDQQSFR